MRLNEYELLAIRNEVAMKALGGILANPLTDSKYQDAQVKSVTYAFQYADEFIKQMWGNV